MQVVVRVQFTTSPSERAALNAARRMAKSPDTRRRDRRAAAKSLPSLTAAVAGAEQRWQEIGELTAGQFRLAITTARHDIDRLESEEHIRGVDRMQTAPPALERSVGIEM